MGRGGQRGKLEDTCNTITIKKYFIYQKKLKGLFNINKSFSQKVSGGCCKSKYEANTMRGADGLTVFPNANAYRSHL